MSGGDAHLPRAASSSVHPHALSRTGARAYPIRVILLPHFTRSLLLRSLPAWAFVRVLAMFVAAALPGADTENPLRLVPWAMLAVVATTGCVVWLSARQRNEERFLLSLGYGRARLVATGALPALLVELAVAVAVRR